MLLGEDRITQKGIPGNLLGDPTAMLGALAVEGLARAGAKLGVDEKLTGAQESVETRKGEAVETLGQLNRRTSEEENPLFVTGAGGLGDFLNVSSFVLGNVLDIGLLTAPLGTGAKAAKVAKQVPEVLKEVITKETLGKTGDNLITKVSLKKPEAVIDAEVIHKNADPPSQKAPTRADLKDDKIRYVGNRKGLEKFWDYLITLRPTLFGPKNVFPRQARQFKDPKMKKFLTEDIKKATDRMSAQETDTYLTALEFTKARVARGMLDMSKQTGREISEISRILDDIRLDSNVDRDVMLDQLYDADITPAMQQAYIEASDVADNLSLRMIDLGVFEPGMEKVIYDNIGRYQHIRHRAFDYDITDSIEGTVIWDKTFEFLSEKRPDLPEEEILGQMVGMLEDASPNSLFSFLGGRNPKVYGGELKTRQEVPDVIRDFLGLDKNFLPNFDTSASTQIMDTAAIKWMDDISREGLETGVFSTVRTGTHSSRVNLGVPKVASGTDPVLKKGMEVKRHPDFLDDRVGKVESFSEETNTAIIKFTDKVTEKISFDDIQKLNIARLENGKLVKFTSKEGVVKEGTLRNFNREARTATVRSDVETTQNISIEDLVDEHSRVPIFSGRERALTEDLWAPPEVANLFSGLISPKPDNWFIKATSMVKLGKILRLGTQIRNFGSGLHMTMNSGHWIPTPDFLKGLVNLPGMAGEIASTSGKLGRKLQAVSRRFRNQDYDEDYVLDKVFRNVYHSGAKAGETIEHLGRTKNLLTADPKTGQLIDANVHLAGLNKGPIAFRVKSYRAGDDSWKGMGDDLNQVDIEWAMKGGDAERESLLKHFDEADIKMLSAQWVRDSYQHYPDAWKIGRDLSRFPGSGAFATFKFEMPRNVGNSITIAKKLFQVAKETGNVRWAALGLKRLSGTFLALTMDSYLAEFSARKVGFYDLAGDIASGNAPEGTLVSKPMESFRSLMTNFWDENSSHYFDSADRTNTGDVQISYYDLGYNSPYTDITSLAKSFLRPTGLRPGSADDLSLRAARLVDELGDIYLNQEILISAVVETFINRRLRGSVAGLEASQPITTTQILPNDDLGERARKRFQVEFGGEKGYMNFKGIIPDHIQNLWGKLAPFEAVELEKSLRLTGVIERTRFGRELSPMDEFISAIGGPRHKVKSVGTQLRSKMFVISNAALGIKKDYDKEKESLLDTKSKVQALVEANKDFESVYKQARSWIHDARTLGVSPPHIRQRLASTNLPVAMRKALMGRSDAVPKIESIYPSLKPTVKWTQ
jgi:hypothetical protein